MINSVLLGSLSEGDYFRFPSDPSDLRYQVKAVFPDFVVCLQCWAYSYPEFSPDCVVEVVKSSHPVLD